MNLTWIDVYHRYIVKDEQKPKKQVRLATIKEAIKTDTDYKFMLSCPRGEIYRHSNDGSLWAVYVKETPKGGKRFGMWREFDNMKLARAQTGDYEASWIFDATQLDDVAKILRVRKKK